MNSALKTRITFVPIDENNWQACAKLQVHQEQKRFIPDNINSIIQACFFENNHSLCIYDGSLMIGYLLWGYEKDKERWKIFRFMLDKKYQGIGLGTKALKQFLKSIDKPEVNQIHISHKKENQRAANLYEKIGFKAVTQSNTMITLVYELS